MELPLLCAILGPVLIYAWLQSDERHLTAEDGLGYYLGVSGGLCMLTLLLYPVRKRFRFLRFIGEVKSWFRLHMLLGVIAPVLILLHSNFSLGSLNSTVALTCTLIVATSGFFGRFFYGRIHRGLYGRKARLEEFLEEARAHSVRLAVEQPNAPDVAKILGTFQEKHTQTSTGLVKQIWRVLTGNFDARHVRNRIVKDLQPAIDQMAVEKGWNKASRKQYVAAHRQHLDGYFAAIARAEAFSLYEKLFSLWHMLHLPLFIILVFAVIAHVIAVHLY